MLGIFINPNHLSRFIQENDNKSQENHKLNFVKPIVLPANAELKQCKTDTKTEYFYIENNIINHIPEPVYNIDQIYYVKETWKMPQKASRYKIRILSVDVQCILINNLLYQYQFEFVKP